MLSQVIVLTLFLLAILNCGNSLKILSVDDPIVIADASFAVKELKQLSDSGIYDTITLSKIINATEEIGTYFINLIINLSLKSPYFKSNLEEEVFEMIIMRNKDDGSKVLAINEFPDMKEDKIEELLIEKIKAKREVKKELIRKFEFEDALADTNNTDEIDYEDLISKAEGDTFAKSSRLKNSEHLMRRLPLHLQDIEKRMQSYSLKELYDMSIQQNTNITLFERYRMKKIVDFCINSFVNRIN